VSELTLYGVVEGEPARLGMPVEKKMRSRKW